MLCDPAACKRAFGVLARRIRTLADEIADLDDDLEASITTAAQAVLAMYSVGLDVVGEFLATTDDNPERLQRPLAHRPGQTALRPCHPGLPGPLEQGTEVERAISPDSGEEDSLSTVGLVLDCCVTRQPLLGKFLLIFSLT